jgi:hypothetical protein
MNPTALRETYGVGEDQLAEMVFKLSDKGANRP